jgi:DNA-binding MarR family transcriptional regulator
MGTTTVGRLDVEQLDRLSAGCEYLQSVDRDMTAATLRVLLTIAANPGISSTKLTEKVGLPSSTISQTVSRLGKYGMGDKAGLGLVVSEENPQDRRIRLFTLSSKGEKVLEKYLDLINT